MSGTDSDGSQDGQPGEYRDMFTLQASAYQAAGAPGEGTG
ncbi:hypothetical protein GCM10010315_34330 [Streptomyces luteosporeus]|uniref:Uncharacterized protein n=1 Tax=Streptomyces luteosporeus TaxID=173856 RepID=A0ABN3TTK8_9ACTN